VARESGVERRMRELMDLTLPVAMAAGTGVVLAGLFRGKRIERLVGSAVSLAVASVPEGLPLLATAAQLASAKRLRLDGVLVRNPRCLEVLGRVDTLCVDKTGTVTEGSIELGFVSDGQVTEDASGLTGARVGVLAAGVRAGPARARVGERIDPIDGSLQAAAASISAIAAEFDGWMRHGELPFEAGRSFYAVRGDLRGVTTLAVKGAPEVVLERCSRTLTAGEPRELGRSERARLDRVARDLAERGLRVLAVAEGPTNERSAPEEAAVADLTFLGFLAFRDPIRPTARQALESLRRAGLRPVMITGDHPSTAVAIATQLGLSLAPSSMTGKDVARLSDDELTSQVLAVDVFARVTPSQKVRIVRALMRAGRIVAMVGDGANDAPAIRLANVGIALGTTGSEAARASADVVLGDAHIETLVRIVVEGRALWDSVRDAVSLLIGGNLGEIGFTLLGGLVSGRPPLGPRQLLLVNLFTDVAPATALALRRPAHHELEALANSGPDASMGWQLNRDIGTRAIITAGGATLAWGLSSFLGGGRGASTTALLALVGTQLGQTLTGGERTRAVVLTSLLSSLGLLAIVQTPGVSGTFGCRPLGPLGLGIAIGSSAAATAAGRYAPNLLDWLFPGALGERMGITDTSERVSMPPPSFASAFRQQGTEI
jgi:cation-transporting ATPase I